MSAQPEIIREVVRAALKKRQQSIGRTPMPGDEEAIMAYLSRFDLSGPGDLLNRMCYAFRDLEKGLLRGNVSVSKVENLDG